MRIRRRWQKWGAGTGGVWPADNSRFGEVAAFGFGHPRLAWALNTVIDCVAGALLLGLVANDPGSTVPMLRVSVAGTAPGVGEVHFVLASDCSQRFTNDGSLDVRSEVDICGRKDVCKGLVSERGVLEGE